MSKEIRFTIARDKIRNVMQQKVACLHNNIVIYTNIEAWFKRLLSNGCVHRNDIRREKDKSVITFAMKYKHLEKVKCETHKPLDLTTKQHAAPLEWNDVIRQPRIVLTPRPSTLH